MAGSFFHKKENDKILLISAPNIYGDGIRPNAAVPLLSGQLKATGFDVYCRDFTLELFDTVSKKEFIEKSYKHFKKVAKLPKDKDSIEYKKASLKIRMADNTYKMLLDSINPRTNRVHQSKKMDLYHFMQYPYTFYPKHYTMNYPDLKKQTTDKNANFFISFFENQIKTLPKDVMLIGISICPGDVIFPTLTLARMLKQKYKHAKIVLGGYWYTYIWQEIKQFPDFFDIFCDYLIIGQGENAIVELAKCLKGELDLSQVSNLMYRNTNNEIVKNPEITKVNINKLAYSDFDDIDFKKCEGPAHISMMLSKGCYWGKCRFCTFAKDNKLQVKTIKNVIDEMRYYVEKYNVKTITFTDDALSPNYCNKLSQAIIDAGLKLELFAYAMFDDAFTFEIFRTMRKAGFRQILWGFETNSKRIFDIVNKSGCFEKRDEILKRAYRAGIINWVSFIEGLPGEKWEDLLKTLKFLYDNIAYIDRYNFEPYQMMVGSEFTLNAEKYGMRLLGKDDFGIHYRYANDITDIDKEHSFMNFMQKFRHMEFDSRDLLRVATREYFETFAPELL